MKKQMINVAIALLIILGVTACSSSTGSSSSQGGELSASTTPTNTYIAPSSDTESSDTTENTATTETIETENTDSNADNSVVENTDSNIDNSVVENNDTTDTENSEIIVPSQIIVATNPSASDSSSAVYKYLNEDSESLLSAINSIGVTTLSATCSNNASGDCSSANKAQGDVMIAKKQSYSSYAVIRENYDAEDVPANSYVAVNTNPVTAENIAKVSGTYTGQATYSAKNRPNALTRDFTMTVTDTSVSGEIYTQATNGNKTTWVSLNETALSVENGAVTFAGSASFNESTFGVTDGTYQGSFAGNDSEVTEVIGTFESTQSTDAGSVQGAFAGTKE